MLSSRSLYSAIGDISLRVDSVIAAISFCLAFLAAKILALSLDYDMFFGGKARAYCDTSVEKITTSLHGELPLILGQAQLTAASSSYWMYPTCA